MMAATPNSPVWAALSKGTGGFKDAIGSGEPPFAFNSGLGWTKINYEDKSEKEKEKSSVTKKIVAALKEKLSLKIIFS